MDVREYRQALLAMSSAIGDFFHLIATLALAYTWIMDTSLPLLAVADPGGTMLVMAKKRQDDSEKPKPHRAAKYILYARLPPALGDVLETYIRQTKPRPDKTAVVELALEEYLARVGFWPPADKESHT